MADQHIDIERMVMQAHYKMQLEAEASSVKGGKLSDMEREQYQNQIKDLLQAVETLLKSNNAMVARSLKIPLSPNLLLTVARMRMRKNTLRMVARTMFLQLMMTRKSQETVSFP